MAGTDYKLRIKGQDQTGKAFGKVNKNINSTQSAMKKLAGAFAGAFAVRQLVQFNNEALQIADSLGKTAVATGVGVEFLQRYQFAAQQAGVETEKFNKALKFFSKGIGEATQGKGLAKEAFDDLGLSIFDAGGNTKKTEKIFIEFFTALEKVSSESRRSALLAGTFGAKVGIDMANLIKDGTTSMQDLAEAATGIFTEETIKDAERFNDTMNILRREVLVPVQTLLIDINSSFLDLLTTLGVEGIVEKDAISKLNDNLEEAEKRLKGNFFQRFFNMKPQKGTFFDPELIQKEIDQIKKRIELQQKVKEEQNDFNKATTKFTETHLKAMGNVARTLNSSFEEFFDFTKKGFLDFENLSKRILASVINEMIKVFIIKKALGMASDAFGGAETVLGRVFKNAGDNYEGGGFTGSGARAGGMDGRGGFMAMLHPNETVIDHTKGQGMGTTVNFNINTVDATGFDQLLVSRKGTITQIINNAMNNQGKMGVV
tara:strand:- start:338 stop:1798 length:1461 start_codon:yes stop_codon:yes gene_type:complete